MTGLPDPDIDGQFYEGVPARRLAAWFVDLAVLLAIGVPLAVVFGLATLGSASRSSRSSSPAVGFFYRTATIAAGSATWGMRLMGIELRRGDGSRFDFMTALLHTAHLFGLPRRVCSSSSAAPRCWPPGTGQGLPGHHPGHDGDQPARGLTARRQRRGFTSGLKSCCRRADGYCYPRAKGKATKAVRCATACRSRTSSTSRPHSLARTFRARSSASFSPRCRAKGRASERRALAPGLPALAERALPPVLRRLFGLPLGAHRRRGFVPRRGQHRVLRRNADLERVARSPWATEAQYELFRRYLDARHATGGMADMDMQEFAAMIEETPVRSRVVEYYRRAGPGGRELVAVCLTDLLSGRRLDGLLLLRPRPVPREPRQLYHPRPRGDRAGGGAALCLPRLLGAGQRENGLQVPLPAAGDLYRRPLELSATPIRRGHPPARDRPAISEQVAAIELPVTK